MPDRVSTIRFKVEGTQQVTSKISELNREAVRQQRDLARSLSQAMKEDAGGVDPRDTIRRARTDALRLANIRQMQVKEQANLEQRELANSRTQLANQARVRVAEYRKQQEGFSDLARVRLNADEKADRTVLSRRQKRNEAEHKLMASERQRVQKDRLADLSDFIGREDAKAKAYEEGQKRQEKSAQSLDKQRVSAYTKEILAKAKLDDKAAKAQLKAQASLDRQRSAAMAANAKRMAREEAIANRESTGGALSGFGGKMVLGMGIGQVASDAGIGDGIGAISSGFMFGGPAIGSALAGLEIVGSVIRGVRELRAETRAYENDLAGIAAQAQVAGMSTLAVTSLGLERTKEREQIALQAEADRKKHEQEKTDLPWFLNWKLRDIGPAGQAISNQEDELYRQSQHLAHQRINARSGEDAAEEQRAQVAQNRAERSQAVESARLGATPGAAAEAMRDRLQTTQNESRLQFEINQERKKLIDAQREKRDADAHVDLNRQKQDLDDFNREAAEKQAASRQEDAYRERARSADFIYSENNRLSPVYQLKEYGIRLKEAVDQNVETIDGAKLKMQRKVMELYSSVLAPHDFKVGDSRSRLNLAAMNPMMAMVMAGAKIPAYADGTDNHPGGPALVGERGPEVVTLPRGSKVQSSFAAWKENRWRNAPDLEHYPPSELKEHEMSPYLAARQRSEWYSGTTGDWDYSVDSHGQRYHKTHAPPPLITDLLNAASTPGRARELAEYQKRNDDFIRIGKSADGLTVAQRKAKLDAAKSPYEKMGIKETPDRDTVGWAHAAGYYQPHSMLARVRAAHRAHAKASGGLIDPLTGRSIDTGMFGGTDARGGGAAGAIGQSQQLAQIARQILQIMQGYQGLQ